MAWEAINLHDNNWLFPLCHIVMMAGEWTKACKYKSQVKSNSEATSDVILKYTWQ